MAIMHFRVSHVSRSTGRSTVQSAAYITGERLLDARNQETVFYRRDQEAIHSWGVSAPKNAPAAFKTLEGWNALEAFEDAWAESYFKNAKALENHKNSARISMNIIAALPRELTLDQSQELVKQFVYRAFVSNGHYVTYGLHDEEGNPHAHIMVSHRTLDENGEISKTKNRDLCTRAGLKNHRHLWADLTNQHLERHGYEQRVTASSYMDLGIDLLPTVHEGWYAQRLMHQGELSFLSQENHRIREENQERILANPSIIFDYMTKTHATFTMPQLLKKIEDFFPGNEQAVSTVFHALKDQLVLLGEDVSTEVRFTSQDYHSIESQAVETFEKLKDNSWGKDISAKKIAKEIERVNVQLRKESQNPEARLNAEQEAAIYGICRPDQVSVLVGRAGAGKTTSMRVLKTLYEKHGYSVVGSALSAAAAKNLGDDTGCFAETVRFYLNRWEKLDYAHSVLSAKGEQRQAWTAEDRDKAQKTLYFESKYDLTSKSVFIVDEASMIGTRDWQKILERVAAKGAKLVIVGDGRQFSAIEAGDIHRYMEDHIKPEARFELKEINRQKLPLMKEAALEFSNQNIHQGLALYENAGHLTAVAQAATKEASHQAVYGQMAQDYVQRLQTSSHNGLVLAYSNESCAGLNRAIRQNLKSVGLLPTQEEHVLGLSLALGDRVVFLKNHRTNDGVTFWDTSGGKPVDVTSDHFIRNGSRGTVQAIEKLNKEGEEGPTSYHRLTVKLSDTLIAQIDSACLKPGSVAHGYAVTTHKSQGQTVDWTLVLASPYMDSSAVYVALTRHRYDTRLYYSQSDFDSFAKLQQVLGRASYKDMALDYTIKDANRGYFANVESYRLITLEMAELIAHEDIYGNAEVKERLNILASERATFGQAILANFDQHALYAAQAKLTRQQIEITCGLKERPLSQEEKLAKERLTAYVSLAQEGRSLWEEIKTAGVGALAQAHPHYQAYEALKEQRDALALEIHLRKAIHKPFMRELGSALGYGFGVIEKQAIHALYRQEFEQAKIELDVALRTYQRASFEITQPQFWTTTEFDQKGHAAIVLVDSHLNEKQQSLPKLTHSYLRDQGMDLGELSQAAQDYNRFQLARTLTHPEERQQAQLLAAYKIACREAGKLATACHSWVKGQEPPQAPSAVFSQAPAYEKWQQTTQVVYSLAHQLTPYDAETTQSLCTLFQIDPHKLKGHQHLGELQHLCHQFKNASTLLEKAHPASQLVDWLALDHELKEEVKVLSGAGSPTYRMLQTHQINHKELYQAATLHQIDFKGQQLTESQVALGDTVVAYTTQRRVCGQAFAEISQERGETPYKQVSLYNQPSWSTYAQERDKLDALAYRLVIADKDDLSVFTKPFRLKEEQLHTQAHRHELRIAVQTVLNKDLSLEDRARSYLFIDRCEKDTLDRALRGLEKQHQTDLSDLYKKSSKPLYGLLHQSKIQPKEFRALGHEVVQNLATTNFEAYQKITAQEERIRGQQEAHNHSILKAAQQRCDAASKPPLDHQVQTLTQARVDYEQAAAQAPLSFKEFSRGNRSYSVSELEGLLKHDIGALAQELFAGEAIHSKTATQIRFGRKGSKSVHIAGSKQGLYADFEQGSFGGPLKLIQDRLGGTYKEAVNWAQDWVGGTSRERVWSDYQAYKATAEKAVEDKRYIPIFPAPQEAVDIANNKFLNYQLRDSQETGRYAYRDADGHLLGYVVRIENLKTGDKKTPPLVYVKDLKTDQCYWKWQGFGKESPLYGLDQLAQKPTAPVLIVEGEKTAEAAKKQFPHYAVITWLGGSQAVSRADWSPIQGRDVVVWPDNDQAGFTAAHKVEKLCQERGANSIAIVRLPKTLPQKWDLADRYPESLTPETAQKLVTETLIASQAKQQVKQALAPKIDALIQANPPAQPLSSQRIKEESLRTYLAIDRLCQQVGLPIKEESQAHLLKQLVYQETRSHELRIAAASTDLRSFDQTSTTAAIEALALKKSDSLAMETPYSPPQMQEFKAAFRSVVEATSADLKASYPLLPEGVRQGLAQDITIFANLCPELKTKLDQVIATKVDQVEPQLKEIEKAAEKLGKSSPEASVEVTSKLITQGLTQFDTAQQTVQHIQKTQDLDTQERRAHHSLLLSQQALRQNQISI